jgi:Flp pilus assembly protein TadD
MGLCVAFAWLALDCAFRWRVSKTLVLLASAAAICALSAAALVQTGYWQNSGTLWVRTLACTEDNAIAHNNYGLYLMDQERPEEAIVHFQAAIGIWPDDFDAHANQGVALLSLGRTDAAIVAFNRALAINPNDPVAHLVLGKALYRAGRVEQAIQEFVASIRLNPTSADAETTLAFALWKSGRSVDAIPHFKAALQLNPRSTSVRSNFIDAIWGLSTKPDALQRNGPEALAAAQWLADAEPAPDPLTLRVLAAALAENGDFAQAAATVRRALLLADPQTAAQLRGDIQTYQDRLPLRGAK